MCSKTFDICGNSGDNQNNVQYKFQQFLAAIINNIGYISYGRTETTPSFVIFM